MRASWDEYFMNVARMVATRSTCERKHVGAVLTLDRTILSTGYNGSMRGAPHCEGQEKCTEGTGHCQRTVHAEMNAVAQAAKMGVSIEGSDIYITASPCWSCFKVLINAGVKRIFFGEMYRDRRIFEYAEMLGVKLVDMSHLPAKVDLSALEESLGDNADNEPKEG